MKVIIEIKRGHQHTRLYCGSNMEKANRIAAQAKSLGQRVVKFIYRSKNPCCQNIA